MWIEQQCVHIREYSNDSGGGGVMTDDLDAETGAESRDGVLPSQVAAIGMTRIDLTRYLSSFPGGLRLDICAEPYRSKLEYLEKKLGQKPATVLPVHPRYLSYSMERIACRAEFLQSRQRSTNGVTGWCATNDTLFAEKFARSSLSEWAEFKTAWQKISK